jgi:hypothetical protein
MTDSFDPLLRIPPEKPVGELVWVAGGTFDESSVSLRFFDDHLDPDELTQILGIEPSIAYQKGDIFRGKTYDKIYEIGSWRLRGKRSQVELEEQINQLLDKLPSDLDVWRSMTSRFQADLFCGLWMKRLNRGLNLEVATLQKIAERGLSIGLDVYVDYDIEQVSIY